MPISSCPHDFLSSRQFNCDVLALVFFSLEIKLQSPNGEGWGEGEVGEKRERVDCGGGRERERERERDTQTDRILTDQHQRKTGYRR